MLNGGYLQRDCPAKLKLPANGISKMSLLALLWIRGTDPASASDPDTSNIKQN